MSAVKLHGILFKLRGIAVFLYVCFVSALFFTVFILNPLPLISWRNLAEIGLTPRLFQLIISALYGVILLFGFCAVSSSYAMLLWKAGKSYTRRVNSAFILLDVALNFILFFVGLIFNRIGFGNGVISEYIRFAGAILSAYAVFAVLSDILWYYVNRKTPNIPVPAKAGEKKPFDFGIAAPIFALIGAETAFVPAYVFASYYLYRLLPHVQDEILPEYYVNILSVALVVLTIQVLSVAATLLSRKSKICYFFAILNALSGICVAVCFFMVLSQILIYNLAVYIGEVILIIFSLIAIASHVRYVRYLNAPPMRREIYLPDDDDVSIVDGRRVVSTRTQAHRAPDIRREYRDF